MKEEHDNHAHAALPHIVGLCSTYFILQCFFIAMGQLAPTRDFGFIGAGTGAFKEGFNAGGWPVFLQFFGNPVQFDSIAAAHVPESPLYDENPDEAPDNRLLNPPEPDLKQALAKQLRPGEEALIPLAVELEDGKVGKSGRQALSKLARLLRLSDVRVVVRCDVPRDMPPARRGEDAWQTGINYSLKVAEYLCYEEGLPVDRVQAVANIVGAKGAARTRPAVSLFLRGNAQAESPSE